MCKGLIDNHQSTENGLSVNVFFYEYFVHNKKKFGTYFWMSTCMEGKHLLETPFWLESYCVGDTCMYMYGGNPLVRTCFVVIHFWVGTYFERGHIFLQALFRWWNFLDEDTFWFRIY